MEETATEPQRPAWPRVLVMIVVGIFVVFWAWALFFASKEAQNKIGDREWAARAEQICAPVEAQLTQLEQQRSSDLTVRADLVVESTDLLAGMLDELEAVEPTDEKGKAIVPMWIADYRTLLEDRYRYAELLRSGENAAFTESTKKGSPITLILEVFAGDNEMPSCAPPRGSII